ncbi:MAG: WYL domain-containing protein [Bacteroidota bacterium]
MANRSDKTPRERILRIMRILLERPRAYTKKQLADLCGVSKDTIDNDFKAFELAGFGLDHDQKFRYFFKGDQPYKQLEDLLCFTEEDQLLLEQAIDHISPNSKQAKSLKRKFETLYDFQKLGHPLLRKPYLTKVDTLKTAEEEEVMVRLVGYRSSNSNTESDRLVEPFNCMPDHDTVHTFDVDRDGLRHFRISRVKRVEILYDRPWEYKNKHATRLTDVFRVVDSDQRMVHLRISVGAYKELVERFPMTARYLQPANEPNTFDFQCKVNHEFKGLTNFILGNYHQNIEVLGPEELLDHLNGMVQKMKF